MAGENQGVNGVTEIWKYGSGLADMFFFCQKQRLCGNFAENVLLMEQAKFSVVQHNS